MRSIEMNFYWPVYKSLEKELITLSNQVHFNDKQLDVYSVKISELLIRSVVEIESIAKELFKKNGGEDKQDGSDLFFDTDCLEFLENKWLLSDKTVVVSAQNFYFENPENKTLTPLKKANKRGTSGADWKRAYQAVKHERTNKLSKGNLKHLVRAMAALFLLNIYYKDETFELDKDYSGLTFNENQGSEIFSIMLHVQTGHYSTKDEDEYIKSSDFNKCVYLTKTTDETAKVAREALKIVLKKNQTLKIDEAFKKTNAKIGYSTSVDPENYNQIFDHEYKQIGDRYLKPLIRGESSKFEGLKFEAVINKNQY